MNSIPFDHSHLAASANRSSRTMIALSVKEKTSASFSSFMLCQLRRLTNCRKLSLLSQKLSLCSAYFPYKYPEFLFLFLSRSPASTIYDSQRYLQICKPSFNNIKVRIQFTVTSERGQLFLTHSQIFTFYNIFGSIDTFCIVRHCFIQHNKMTATHLNRLQNVLL